MKLPTLIYAAAMGVLLNAPIAYGADEEIKGEVRFGFDSAQMPDDSRPAAAKPTEGKAPKHVDRSRREATAHPIPGSKEDAEPNAVSPLPTVGR